MFVKIERVGGDYSSALKVGGLRNFRQHAVSCRMINGGLTIYREFIVAMSLLASTCVLWVNVPARNRPMGICDKYHHGQI